MWHSPRVRHWLLSLAVWATWRLGTLTPYATATQTPHPGVWELAHPSPGNKLTTGLEAHFEPLQQCPKPRPCYRSAEAEFCVFTADASGGQGTSRTTPIVAEQRRALEIMKIMSEASLAESSPATLKYTVGAIPGKGLGVISTGSLDRGAHILSDAPSLIIDHCIMSAVPQHHLAELMNAAAERLTDAQRAGILNLAVFGNKAPDAHYLVGRIYATSAYMLDPEVAFFGEGCGVGALFPEVSRMNHDCRPNAAYHFDPDTATMEVRAVRPIAAGEEITVSYISPLLPHAQRQHRLHNRWGFTCTCAACSAPASAVSASDSRLEQMAGLWPLLLDQQPTDGNAPVVTSEDGKKKASEVAELLVSLAEEDLGLDAVMLQPYRFAALEWNAVGERRKAVHYAGLAVEYGTNGFGPWGAEVGDMEHLVDGPEAHWSWRLRL